MRDGESASGQTAGLTGGHLQRDFTLGG